MASIPKFLSHLPVWPLPGLLSKKPDLDKAEQDLDAAEIRLQEEAKKVSDAAANSIANAANIQQPPSNPNPDAPAKIDAKEAEDQAKADAANAPAPSSNANPAAPAEGNAKEVSSPAVIALAEKLPKDTLSKLYEIQQSLTQELDRMLAKPERLTRLGQWGKANGILNDLKLINFQIKTLAKAKAKKLSEKEQKTVGDRKKRLEALVKLAGFDTKLREQSKTLHKNLVEYQHRETEASEEAVLELLSSKDYKTILSEYAARTAKHAGMLETGSLALYAASRFGLLSKLAYEINPLLGLAAAVPETIIAWSPGLVLATPLLAPITALDSNTLSQAADLAYAPAYYLAEELYNLKDAATDTAEFIGNSASCVYGHAKQTVTLGAMTSVASLTARVVANSGIISCFVVKNLADEVTFLAKGAEQATLLLTEGLNPLTTTGLTMIGAGSFVASTLLINNPNIKNPSTKQISYSVPKAADFICKAAVVTTVAAGAIAAYVYAPSMTADMISNITSTIGSSISNITSLISKNSTELVVYVPPAVTETINSTANEIMGKAAVFIGTRAALTAGATYTAQKLPGWIKGAVNYGISKLGGSLPTDSFKKVVDSGISKLGRSLPTALSDKTSNPVRPSVSASPSDALVESLVDAQVKPSLFNNSKDPVEGAGIEDEPGAPQAAFLGNILNSKEPIADKDGFKRVLSKNQIRKRKKGYLK